MTKDWPDDKKKQTKKESSTKKEKQPKPSQKVVSGKPEIKAEPAELPERTSEEVQEDIKENTMVTPKDVQRLQKNLTSDSLFYKR